MKKTTLSFTLLALLIILQSSSNKNQFKYENHITAGMDYVLIQHSISDFKQWKKAFDDDQERRNKEGMSDMLVAYDDGNENAISVVLQLSDLAKAKAFFNDPKTGELMGAAGVTSPPSFTFFNVDNSSIPNGHSFMIIQHDVADYSEWKKAFDAHEGVRSEYKIDVTAVGSQLEDERKIIAIMNSKKSENFTHFLEKSNLQEAMKTAGVTSPPVQHILKEVK